MEWNVEWNVEWNMEWNVESSFPLSPSFLLSPSSPFSLPHHGTPIGSDPSICKHIELSQTICQGYLMKLGGNRPSVCLFLCVSVWVEFIGPLLWLIAIFLLQLFVRTGAEDGLSLTSTASILHTSRTSRYACVLGCVCVCVYLRVCVCACTKKDHAFVHETD